MSFIRREFRKTDIIFKPEVHVQADGVVLTTDEAVVSVAAARSGDGIGIGNGGLQPAGGFSVYCTGKERLHQDLRFINRFTKERNAILVIGGLQANRTATRILVRKCSAQQALCRIAERP